MNVSTLLEACKGRDALQLDWTIDADDSPLVRITTHKMRRWVARQKHQKNQRRRRKAVAFRDRVRQYLADFGVLYVKVWKRDRQHCESTHLQTFDSHDAFFAWRRRQTGCFSTTLLTPEEADAFSPQTRDLILEAHENGHRHKVHT